MFVGHLGELSLAGASMATYFALPSPVLACLEVEGEISNSTPRTLMATRLIFRMQVIKYVAAIMPIAAVSIFLDGFQCVLSGTARGCGWQKIGAFINLGSYYLVGIPSAVSLAFVLHIGGKISTSSFLNLHSMGLWLGIICALIVQVLSLLTITMRTNWEQEVKHSSLLLSHCASDRSPLVAKKKEWDYSINGDYQFLPFF
ncbi:conserved hypothetical protein [Ricinus communis]|uniref:Multidrug resistance pump n=1 Tax=Ricinus communis TaxID=3988 RepID=B9SK44_RICCO|nr:conserved hypothetical protein [Ricinus communis]